jgi:hypothetical protein
VVQEWRYETMLYDTRERLQNRGIFRTTRVKCLVSIGTGAPSLKPFRDDMLRRTLQVRTRGSRLNLRSGVGVECQSARLGCGAPAGGYQL